jgi:hypothetical protein
MYVLIALVKKSKTSEQNAIGGFCFCLCGSVWFFKQYGYLIQDKTVSENEKKNERNQEHFLFSYRFFSKNSPKQKEQYPDHGI